jgi:hypothetical protein
MEEEGVGVLCECFFVCDFVKFQIVLNSFMSIFSCMWLWHDFNIVGHQFKVVQWMHNKQHPPVPWLLSCAQTKHKSKIVYCDTKLCLIKLLRNPSPRFVFALLCNFVCSCQKKGTHISHNSSHWSCFSQFFLKRKKNKPVYLPITQKHGTSMEHACLLANDH